MMDAICGEFLPVGLGVKKGWIKGVEVLDGDILVGMGSTKSG
jgi:hypothetical protein